jgi:hypothetical protein
VEAVRGDRGARLQGGCGWVGLFSLGWMRMSP